MILWNFFKVVRIYPLPNPSPNWGKGQMFLALDSRMIGLGVIVRAFVAIVF
jgi:hypothetical protein